jgi:hypothetical protein
MKANAFNSVRASIKQRRSLQKSNQYRQAFHRAVVDSWLSSQQVADAVLQRFQMARRAGMSIEAATDFAFEVEA